MTIAMTHVDRIVGYNVLSVLGYGASSTIYCARDPKDGQVYAVKRVTRNSPSDQRFIDQAVNEYRVATSVDHPNLRRCFKLKRQRKLLTTSELLLVMEMVQGRNLVQERPNQLAVLVKVFLDVTEALGAMHKAGWVHADIKPNNILVTEKREVKVIDLGQSCKVGTVKDRIQGTPDYIAPEQVRRRALSGKTDIFNFGATMYWCVTDSHVPTLIPKNSNEIGLKTDLQLRQPVDFNPDLPLALNNLIVHCLKKRPEERPENMAEVRARLELCMTKVDRDQPARKPS